MSLLQTEVSQIKNQLKKSKIKAIILAAGQSKRLRPFVQDRPKCLLELGDGRTILNYHIGSLLHCGVLQILIVAGYKRSLVADYVKQLGLKAVRIVANPFFDATDNAYSVALALQHVNLKSDVVVILDGDILFDFSLLVDLVNTNCANTLVVDNCTNIGVEDSKVLIKDGFVQAVGKKVNGSAVYASLIKLSGDFLGRFNEEVQKPTYRRTWYSEPLNKVLKSYPREVFAIFTNGRFRCDVDTYDEYLEVGKTFRMLELGGAVWGV